MDFLRGKGASKGPQPSVNRERELQAEIRRLREDTSELRKFKFHSYPAVPRFLVTEDLWDSTPAGTCGIVDIRKAEQGSFGVVFFVQVMGSDWQEWPRKGLVVIKFMKQGQAERVQCAHSLMSVLGCNVPWSRVVFKEDSEWKRILNGAERLQSHDTSAGSLVHQESMDSFIKKFDQAFSSDIKSLIIMQYVPGRSLAEALAGYNSELFNYLPGGAAKLFEQVGSTLLADLLIFNADRFHMEGLFQSQDGRGNAGNCILSMVHGFVAIDQEVSQCETDVTVRVQQILEGILFNHAGEGMFFQKYDARVLDSGKVEGLLAHHMTKDQAKNKAIAEGWEAFCFLESDGLDKCIHFKRKWCDKHLVEQKKWTTYRLNHNPLQLLLRSFCFQLHSNEVNTGLLAQLGKEKASEHITKGIVTSMFRILNHPCLMLNSCEAQANFWHEWLAQFGMKDGVTQQLVARIVMLRTKIYDQLAERLNARRPCALSEKMCREFLADALTSQAPL